MLVPGRNVVRRQPLWTQKGSDHCVGSCAGYLTPKGSEQVYMIMPGRIVDPEGVRACGQGSCVSAFDPEGAELVARTAMASCIRPRRGRNRCSRSCQPHCGPRRVRACSAGPSGGYSTSKGSEPVFIPADDAIVERQCRASRLGRTGRAHGRGDRAAQPAAAEPGEDLRAGRRLQCAVGQGALEGAGT